MGRQKKHQFSELIRVYHDLERTLKGLRANLEKNTETSLRNINVRALIVQLTRSKRRLERKIGNTLLLEKQHIKRRFRAITHQLTHRESEL